MLLGRVGVCARLGCRQGLSLSLGLVIPVWDLFFYGKQVWTVCHMAWSISQFWNGLSHARLILCPSVTVSGVSCLSWKCFPHSPSRIKCFLTHFDARTASQIKCRFASFSSPVPAGFQSHCRGQKLLLVYVDNELKLSAGLPCVCVCLPFLHSMFRLVHCNCGA